MCVILNIVTVKLLKLENLLNGAQIKFYQAQALARATPSNSFSILLNAGVNAWAQILDFIWVEKISARYIHWTFDAQ